VRIAYFHYSTGLGGSERFLADVVAGAGKAGHETVVLSPQRSLLDFVQGYAPDVELVELALPDLPSGSAPASTIVALVRTLPGISRSLRRARATLLHVNNGGYPGSDHCRLAVLTAPLVRIPVRLMTVNNMPQPREDSQPQLQAIVDRLVWRSVHAVHVPSAFVKGEMQELRGMPSDLCAHIRYGVAEPQGDANADLRPRLASGRAGLLVGMVAASGEWRKGHYVFLDALTEVDTDVSAVVVGAHPGDSFLEQIERLGLGDRIELTGPVSSEQVGPYLRAMDVVVVPSVAYESQVLVILEAMAAGKAVFASRLDGIPEALVDGQTGRLFTPGAAGELAALLREARANPERLDEMGRAGRERWRARYTSGEMVGAMLALYEELAARHATPGKARHR
jgi:glycosyltransferase involved in cell wall biosynthesis